MAAPLTEHERKQVVDALASGRSCRRIAADLHRSPSTVSKIATEAGHVFEAEATARACRARDAYSAERETHLYALLFERAEGIAKQMVRPRTLVRMTQQGEWIEHTIERPNARATCDCARAVSELIRAAIVLKDKADAGLDDSCVDDYLAFLKNSGSLSPA